MSDILKKERLVGITPTEESAEKNLNLVELEYIYITIPADYICVYHRLLIMLSDYGEEMLKDCKATCKDRNSGIIECFNMFNAAVAARKLGKTSLAEVLIKYIKTKINQIYGGKDNSTSFVFPVDENGQLKAVVSCGELPKFWISADDANLYEHKFGNGFDEHFRLGPEDGIDEQAVKEVSKVMTPSQAAIQVTPLTATIIPSYEYIGGEYRPCADIKVYYNARQIDVNNTNYQYYFDDIPVIRFNDVTNLEEGPHLFECVVNYNGKTAIAAQYLNYEKAES